MNQPLEIKKVALVTGASRGIGRGIALELGRHGWRIGVNFRHDAASASSAVQAITESGGEALALQADITLESDRQQLLNRVQEQWGRLDLLVNNAGIAPRQRVDLLDLSEGSYDEVMAANLKGPFFLTQKAARWMIALKQAGVINSALIVNIGSISAYTASINRGEYCLSKAGLAMMTALFADRLASEGILVYELRPGIIETDMTAGVHEKYDRLIELGLLPLQRWGTPQDVAKAVLAIAEGRLPYSTGEVINIDGGFHLRRL